MYPEFTPKAVFELMVSQASPEAPVELIVIVPGPFVDGRSLILLY